jgi:hypothetical protein
MPSGDVDLGDVSACDIQAAVLRTCPAYELVPLEQMTARERAGFRAFQHDSDTYGILRPREPGLTVLAVDESTAALYRAVTARDGLSGFDNPCRDPTALERLVLDRVLEVAAESTFVSGPAAYAWLYPAPEVVCGTGLIAQLSHNALRYAQGLMLGDSVALSLRLYGYNRLPLSPVWRRRLPSADAMLSFLDIQAGGCTRRLLDENCIELADSRWLYWRARAASPQGPRPYKLYVSPRPEQLPETFGTAVRLFIEMQVPAFKVVSTVGGILRPDKLVAYFQRSSDLRAAATQLADSLPRVTAHGVPFTATDDPTGLLSWGLDPPFGSGRLINRPISWRRWLTDRLAAALVLAGTAPIPDREPWEFALRRLALAGVDVATWQPVADCPVGAVYGAVDGDS